MTEPSVPLTAFQRPKEQKYSPVLRSFVRCAHYGWQLSRHPPSVDAGRAHLEINNIQTVTKDVVEAARGESGAWTNIKRCAEPSHKPWFAETQPEHNSRAFISLKIFEPIVTSLRAKFQHQEAIEDAV